jgi:hypothetical protein
MIKASSHLPDSPLPDTTTAMDGGGGAGNDIIDSEAAREHQQQQRERRRQQQQQNPLQPILSSLLLSSIREEEGEDNNDDDDDDDDPDDTNRHHRVMHAVVDTTMQVMDYIEDEIDTNTWNKLDDFVPMQLRLAIEDQVFGWDHFLSSILGHVGYTLGSYLATYWLVTSVVLRQVPWGSQRGDADRDHADDLRPWGMPYELFAFLRTALSIGSAISTFRTIRRRRRVWLPVRRASSSSSSSSAADAAVSDLRSTFHEADRLSRRFVLGAELWNKMRRSYAKRRDRVLARNVRRRLERAESLFEQRRRRMHGGRGDDGGGGMMRSISASSLLSLLSNDEDDDDVVDGDVVHRDVADGEGRSVGGGSVGGGSVGGGGMRRNRQRRRRLRREYESAHHERVRVLGGVGGDAASRGSGADDDGEDETDESMGGGPSIAEDGEDDERSRRGRSRTRADRFQMLDSHTLPNFAMESVCHDQMPFAYGEIKKVPYVHGVSLYSFYLLTRTCCV